MSLLDVLCGALGAFCFMMLTLFPYYSNAHKHDQTGGGDTAALHDQYERAQRQLQEAQQRIQQLESEAAKAGGNAGDAAAMQRQLQQAWQKMQSAQQQLQEASKRIEKLEMRFPVAVQIMWLTDKQDVDIYLWRPADIPQPAPVLDHKNNLWMKGDSRTDWVSGPGFESWQMRDLLPTQPAKLYYVLFNQNGNNGPAYVIGSILSADGAQHIPPVQLDSQTRILHVADVVRSADDKLALNFTPEFQQHRVGASGTQPPATQSEQERPPLTTDERRRRLEELLKRRKQ